MGYYKKLVGEKVYLSPVNIEDVEKYTEWVNDLEVGIYVGFSASLISKEKEREFLERLSKEGHNFAIVDKACDQLIGNCGFLNMNSLNRTAEIGLFIGDKDYWSKGYGQDAIQLLLDYGFNLLNLNNIMLTVKDFNKRAIRCYEKCGFKVFGVRREACIFGEKRYGLVYMDILASEFRGKVLEDILP